MKAAILKSPRPISENPLRVVEKGEPTGSSGCVKIRVHACGVCRTDLHIVEGELPLRRDDLIPGHQIVGEIVGGETHNLSSGTRVGVSWIGGTDGTCAYCRNDLENLCDSPTFTGYS